MVRGQGFRYSPGQGNGLCCGVMLSVGEGPEREQCSSAKRVALPPYNLTGVPTQRNRAQMKEQSKTSERELSDEETANLSDGEFKALVIKIFTQLIELGQKKKK